ncbi:nuclear receptor 2C2-associated protein [Schistocerca cancellata]|uniref:nuclear receptor 2C2-associated protein n=1 Tax=Schistocerca cancellata TaxID=274614 RepID=UPI002118B793|nr:nuclear receptor 2C2-associated protein [Schistocerca cancellata]
MAISLSPSQLQCRVSSVLNRDVKLYGKKHIFDGNDETCWNSDQGSPQWIEIEFPDVKNLSAFEIQFQGGFVGKDCQIEIVPGPESEKYVEPFYPEDINSLQKFSLKSVTPAKVVKFVFNSSTDFFGRIVVYNLTLYGSS